MNGSLSQPHQMEALAEEIRACFPARRHYARARNPHATGCKEDLMAAVSLKSFTRKLHPNCRRGSAGPTGTNMGHR
jgi:hypothetical protein